MLASVARSGGHTTNHDDEDDDPGDPEEGVDPTEGLAGGRRNVQLLGIPRLDDGQWTKDGAEEEQSKDAEDQGGLGRLLAFKHFPRLRPLYRRGLGRVGGGGVLGCFGHGRQGKRWVLQLRVAIGYGAIEHHLLMFTDRTILRTQEN